MGQKTITEKGTKGQGQRNSNRTITEKGMER